MITIEKIKIYERYKNEGDRPTINARREHELALFEGDEWAVIGRFDTDMPMFNNNLADHAYITPIIKELHEQCEPDAFRLIAGKLTFYKYFQGVIDILQQIKENTAINSDTVWAGYGNAEEFLTELEQDIGCLKYCDFTILEKIKIKFSPTGAYQELAISNGWGDTYLKMAEDFDSLYERITEGNIVEDEALPITKPVWWKRLFGFKS